MTISRGTKDVPLELLDVLEVFLKNNTLKGGAAFEVGSRNYNLHVQSAFSIIYPKTAESQRELTKHIKALLPDNGKGYRIQCKPFGAGQTWEAMLGYITKDTGRSSYQIRTHNITPKVH